MKRLLMVFALLTGVFFVTSTFAQPASRPNGMNTPVVGKIVRFEIRKATGNTPIPGSYQFTVWCNGAGGPYTGPNPVVVVLPSPGMTSVTVPAGDVCGVKETQPTGNWNAPGFSGSGVAVTMGAPWEAKVGPINANGGVVTVANRPRKMVRFEIRKTTGDTPIPGSYQFNVWCNGAGGPYTGPNPVTVVLPSPGITAVAVPAGDVCGVKEIPPPGNWNPPGFTGTGVAVEMGAPWEAKVGPISANGGVVTCANRRKSASVLIPNLNMQGGNENTECPAPLPGPVYTRAQAAAPPSTSYLHIMLASLDVLCNNNTPGFQMKQVQFLKCWPDPRGAGFGPNAIANLTCGQ